MQVRLRRMNMVGLGLSLAVLLLGGQLFALPMLAIFGLSLYVLAGGAWRHGLLAALLANAGGLVATGFAAGLLALLGAWGPAAGLLAGFVLPIVLNTAHLWKAQAALPVRPADEMAVLRQG
ncbi:hypothetical protein OOT46_20880 [Aquabacterium sp. A7-Y]|uniref:hypothetical protein n=1 Tax=Aquabacterium sp. A7-Y TaxID=1349605 RepID=UPI00223CF103|nr:hypothetical protein [Aquabacterium sp. A7-Y]MCW7540293.1 hypothetical protein [Aquabacterium sp. A7-Y]